MQPAIANPLEGYIERYVRVITADGRIFTGFLRGLDQAMNAVLSQCEQRIYSLDTQVEVEPLGLYFIRGDTIVLLGEVDEQLESESNWQQQRAAPLKPINMQ